jgi:hypothetical protein
MSMLHALAKDIEALLRQEFYCMHVERLRSQDDLIGHQNTGIFVFEDYEQDGDEVEVVGVTVVVNLFEMDTYDGARMLLGRITEILGESYLFHVGNLTVQVTGSVYDED